MVVMSAGLFIAGGEHPRRISNNSVAGSIEEKKSASLANNINKRG